MIKTKNKTLPTISFSKDRPQIVSHPKKDLDRFVSECENLKEKKGATYPFKIVHNYRTNLKTVIAVCVINSYQDLYERLEKINPVHHYHPDPATLIGYMLESSENFQKFFLKDCLVRYPFYHESTHLFYQVHNISIFESMLNEPAMTPTLKEICQIYHTEVLKYQKEFIR